MAGCGVILPDYDPLDKRPASSPVGGPVSGSAQHLVRRGETAYAIARQYGVPLSALIKANDLKPPYRLIVGDHLVLPGPDFYTVVPGDTLYALSRRFDVGVEDLARANALSSPEALQPGQALRVPKPPKKGDGAQPSTMLKPPPQSSTPTTARAEPTLSKPESPPPAPRRSGRFSWPVRGRVVIPFGEGSDGRRHDGLNIAAPRGTPVRAAENGVAAYSGSDLRGYGKMILLRHADGYLTAYAHNDILLVAQGAVVRRGQIIARVGSTGAVETPQLHFQIRRQKRILNPTLYLE